MGHGTAAMAQETASDLECRLAQAERELSEALERQAATDEVLRVISSSPSELEHVFETIVANATRLCEAKFGNLFLYETMPLVRSRCMVRRVSSSGSSENQWSNCATIRTFRSPESPLAKRCSLFRTGGRTNPISSVIPA